MISLWNTIKTVSHQYDDGGGGVSTTTTIPGGPSSTTTTTTAAATSTGTSNSTDKISSSTISTKQTLSSSSGSCCYCIDVVVGVDEQKQQQQQQQQEEIEEDCPLCCNSMTIGDIRYPLKCPTKTCTFNYCYNCIVNFCMAANDGYSLASDGSYQLKVSVKCPMCRAKYQLQQQHTITSISPKNGDHPRLETDTTGTGTTTIITLSSDVIIKSILSLRDATRMETILNTTDSALNASDLAKRDEYIRSTTIEQLQDAYKQLQLYHRSLSNDCTNTDTDTVHGTKQLTVIPLDWELLRSVLRGNDNDHSKQDSETNVSKDSTSSKLPPRRRLTTTRATATSTVPWKDPTLLGGLEELMTVAEHEFITSMMISGQIETIAQAATILNSILEMSTTRRATSAIQQLTNTISVPDTRTSSTGVSTSASFESRPVRLNVRDVEHISRMRRRFPLPINMPRCVSIPVYDPTDSKSKHTILNFMSDTNDKTILTLTLKNVSGHAGRVGLRKGDIITHIDGTAIETYDEFVTVMSQRYLSTTACDNNNNKTATAAATLDESTVQVVVNATIDVAIALQKRYHQMQEEKIRFLYG